MPARSHPAFKWAKAYSTSPRCGGCSGARVHVKYAFQADFTYLTQLCPFRDDGASDVVTKWTKSIPRSLTMIAFPQFWLAMFLLSPAPPQNPPEVAPASPPTPATKSPQTSSPAPAPRFPLIIPSKSVSTPSPPAPPAPRPRRIKDDDKEHHDSSSTPALGASRPRRVKGDDKEHHDSSSPPVRDAWRVRLPRASILTPLPPPADTSPPAPD